jgi:hypothetical protein
MNHFILVGFDICRYDSLKAARPKTIRELFRVPFVEGKIR